MNYKTEFKIGNQKVSYSSPCYFIADIASSHDGELSRAKSLVWLAKEAGADCVKFQHFKAESIVSDHGFKNLGKQGSHQAKWNKSVYDVFKQCEFNRAWNGPLAEEAKKAGIHFMTTPYDFQAVDEIDPLVPAYKIGSGDITWLEILQYVAAKGKPVILASGASSMDDVSRAIDAILEKNGQLALLQCNTNYTGSLENFKYVNLNVLKQYAQTYPNMILGLSDHTPGHATVLGSIALGARIVEKHFTDDNSRVGPDHAFSMNPRTWREMIDRSRELEAALGDGIKKVEENEKETVVLQRRCLRTTKSLPKGHVLTVSDIVALRPAPADALQPFDLKAILNKPIRNPKASGEALTPQDFQ